MILPRRPSIFRKIDLTRALKAAREAGVELARVEIDLSGKIILVTGKPTKADAVNRSTEAEAWINEHAHKS
jgi:hypothetical protein